MDLRFLAAAVALSAVTACGSTAQHGGVTTGAAAIDGLGPPAGAATGAAGPPAAAGGQTFQGKRLAEAVAFAFCDGLRLISGAAKAGGGLTGPDLARGIQVAGPSLSSAFGFGNGLGPGRHFLPGAVRDLAYDDACTCFRYTGTATYPL